jgi:hypothetical protein
MFERYAEKARRVIFFARYEASQFGASHIQPEHLLLGILREDKAFTGSLGTVGQIEEEFRKEVESASVKGPKMSTSVDMPLSATSKRVLELAADEADTLRHKVIAVGHLVLGLLRIPGLASDFLVRHGVSVERQRVSVIDHENGVPLPSGEPPTTYEGPLGPKMNALLGVIASNVQLLDPAQRLKRKPWTRAEALGHLINLAVVHHEWLSRALTEAKVVAAGYPEETWVDAQRCDGYSWEQLVDLWVSLNRFLVHMVGRLTEEKLGLPCKIGVAEPITLAELIGRYVTDVEDLAGQVLAKL